MFSGLLEVTLGRRFIPSAKVPPLDQIVCVCVVVFRSPQKESRLSSELSHMIKFSFRDSLHFVFKLPTMGGHFCDGSLFEFHLYVGCVPCTAVGSVYIQISISRASCEIPPFTARFGTQADGLSPA